MESKKCSISILSMPCQLVGDQVFEAYCWGCVNETLRIVNVKKSSSKCDIELQCCNRKEDICRPLCIMSRKTFGKLKRN